jgi:hypothetical protein
MVSRRKFLTLSFITGFSSFTFSVSAKNVSSERTIQLEFTQEMIQVGRCYLNQYPEENSKELITNSIDKICNDTYSSESKKSIVSRINEACTKDYKARDTIYLDGWLMARTEARLCALAALSY